MYEQEEDMYPDICYWLQNFLKHKEPDAEIIVEDTSRVDLSNWLIRMKYHDFFPEHPAYEIKVDVTGVIKSSDSYSLAFVECKLKRIKLRDISQLLGYSRVARPQYSIVLSPEGISDALKALFDVHRRFDVLEYDNGRIMAVAKWSRRRREPLFETIIPRGHSDWVF